MLSFFCIREFLGQCRLTDAWTWTSVCSWKPQNSHTASCSFSIHHRLRRPVSLLVVICAAVKEAASHGGTLEKDPEELDRLSLSFPPHKSASERTDRHLHGHLCAPHRGPRHFSLRDQKDLCHAMRLRAKHTHTEGRSLRTDRAEPVAVGSYTWHLGSGGGTTGAGAFLASVQPRQDGNRGLNRRPRPFRKTLLDRL